MHVSCRNRGIVELDLQSVFANDQERGALAVVKSLDLSHNELSQLGGLQPFSSLVALDLSYNKLMSLHGLPLGLVRLNVSNNQLSSIEGLATLPLLQDLDVSNNKLTNVNGIQRSSPLTSLKLGNNRLSSGKGIEGLQHLQTLELHGNYINGVEDLTMLSTNRKLKNLTINNNPLTQVATYRSGFTKMLGALLTLDGSAVQRVEGDMANSSFNTSMTPSRRGSGDLGGAKPLASVASLGSARGHTRPASPSSNANRSRSSTPVRYASSGQRPHTPTNIPSNASMHSRARTPTTMMNSTMEGAPSSRTPAKPGTPRGQTPAGATLNQSAIVNQSAVTNTPQRAPLNSSLAFDSVKQRADSRRTELNSSKKQLELNVGELQALLEEEYQLTSGLQKQKKKLEAELSETKKVLSEELQKITSMAEDNQELRAQCEEMQALNVKCLKIHKHSELKLKEERARRIGDMDKLKSSHNVVVEGLRHKMQDGAESLKQSEETYNLWVQEKTKLHEYIQILEKENSSLAVKLSKYENAAADAQHMAANEFSGMALSPVKKSPATPKHEHEHERDDAIDITESSQLQERELSKLEVQVQEAPTGMSDARRLIEMSRNMNANRGSRPASVASATTPKAGANDIQWAGPPSDVGSTVSETANIQFAIHMKKLIIDELGKKPTPTRQHPTNPPLRQAQPEGSIPTVEELWSRGNSILYNQRSAMH
eukprot:TRINITY_DN5182_c1_g1_i1.p1 TRINITY_DN5182_c1_g1~~TRINITY_DN5182_c1_g1_i1.p1  ORF type:complete len:712 (+),score=147.09 TRINITY_DN5182_c1_g1_i1:37-2172(+)